MLSPARSLTFAILLTHVRTLDRCDRGLAGGGKMFIDMTRVISMLLIALITVPLLVAQGNKNDDRIYNDVRARLADDPDIKGATIEVTVKDGAVTLKGRVGDALARDKATKVTKKAKGVTTVDNQLKLFSES